MKRQHNFPKSIIALLTAVSLIAGCGMGNPYSGIKRPGTSSASSISNTAGSQGSKGTQDAINSQGSEDTDAKESDESAVDIDKRFKEILKPADDDLDFKYANDYVASTIIHYKYARDSKGYPDIFGYEKPTKDELYKAIDANTGLLPEYKDFIKKYVNDWLTLWPESDFSVLKYNLETLKIERMSDAEIKKRSLAPDAGACYVNSENLICLNETINFNDKASGDYIIMTHELTHAARSTRTTIGENDIAIRFYEDSSTGLYEDEALITLFAFELQGLNNRSPYYTLQCSIYRQLLPYLNYDGADYMNHSFSYFMDCLQDYFDKVGIECPAYHFTNLVDCQAIDHYVDYQTPAITDFDELYKTIVHSYCFNHLTDDMSLQETDAEFEVFFEDISFHFDEMKNPYSEVTKEKLKPYWDEYIKNKD